MIPVREMAGISWMRFSKRAISLLGIWQDLEQEATRNLDLAPSSNRTLSPTAEGVCWLPSDERPGLLRYFTGHKRVMEL